ncbi:hypothetical protein AVEN_37366-1, partial [Araneus ventricosus]
MSEENSSVDGMGDDGMNEIFAGRLWERLVRIGNNTEEQTVVEMVTVAGLM